MLLAAPRPGYLRFLLPAALCLFTAAPVLAAENGFLLTLEGLLPDPFGHRRRRVQEHSALCGDL